MNDTLKIKREMSLWSTAAGYDIKVCLVSERGEYVLRAYRNITPATMKRFYKLSNSWMTLHAEKQVNWWQNRRIFA